MKKVILLAAVLFACGKKEEPAADTAALAAGPPPLTAADLAGTWNGTAMAENSDSVLFKFTVWSPTGTDSKTLIEGQKDTVAVTHMISGDSLVATSAPHVDPTMPGKPTVVFRAVGRLMGGKLAGNATVMLASKPDSVLARNRFEMTKAP
ncbi:MAG TPA: hypothetical protein VGQ52_21110 [Gemmatimonadaceae bacterium]|nr:hypothetical protein [Gemmatimonadaceae bacterium]